MAGDFLDRAVVDHGADLRGRVAGRAHVQGCHTGAELLGKGLVHRAVHKDAIGADAGLAAVAELGGHEAVHGRSHIGVLENDEGRIAAQFERELFEGVGAAARQVLAHGRGAGEGDLAHAAVIQPLIDHLGRALARGRDDVEHPGRHPGFVRQQHQGQ